MVYFILIRGFPDSLVGKESACNAEDPSSISGSGRSGGEGIGSTGVKGQGQQVPEEPERLLP